MNTNKTKKSAIRFYFALLAATLLPSCGEGCIQLTGCNIALPGLPGAPATESEQQELSPAEEVLYNLGLDR